jgi:hypothetical protein
VDDHAKEQARHARPAELTIGLSLALSRCERQGRKQRLGAIFAVSMKRCNHCASLKALIEHSFFRNSSRSRPLKLSMKAF